VVGVNLKMMLGFTLIYAIRHNYLLLVEDGKYSMETYLLKGETYLNIEIRKNKLRRIPVD
jgi:hypothetical protein